MKYRLVELLRCPRCGGDLEVGDAQHALSGCRVRSSAQCRRYCALNRVTTIPETEQCERCSETEIVSGRLECAACGQKFNVVESVPWLFEDRVQDRSLLDTAILYGHLWKTVATSSIQAPSHVERVEEALGESVVRGEIGLDAGSGSGTDTLVLARRHPSVELISLDLSEGVYLTKRATEGLPNVHLIRGSLLELPLRSGTCNFAYSFGSLHHIPNPLKGLQELARVLKAGGQVSVYLYEDHSNNPWKAIPLKAVATLRALTVKLNTKVLSGLCYLLSPFVVLLFSVPARIMSQFERTRGLAEQLPFNFGTSPFSVHSDLLDRFGAPIEVRYSRDGVIALLRACQLTDIRTAKLKTLAGWVARAVKA